ncbi:MAG: PQQ-binding-like beta-propeller repeat protein [Phycisphaerales bacterium]|nr:PQQ-binding-like beta-propeller repeat protein [Phycisphaerales bacterium]
MMHRITFHLAAIGALAVATRADDWTHYAQNSSRLAAVPLALRPDAPIGAVDWTATTGPSGQSLAFLGQSSIVQCGDHVVALGWVGGVFAAIDVRRADGSVRWFTPIAAPALDSWASPAIDTSNQTVIVATGRQVRAIALADGAILWTASTTRDIANASPLVTTDRGAADRVFITDFGFTSVPGRLYCINVDPFDAAINPYAPGQVVWSRTIGQISGATPALASDKVIIATGDGRILAFPVDATAPPEPAWERSNPTGLGFFGTVAVRGNYAYAASYSFYGGQTSANLVKLNVHTGSLVWSTPCNRTDAAPIPLANGTILLSGGISGFGSAPSLELFADLGGSAFLMWDTMLSGGPSVGYWMHTPVAIESSHGYQVLVSTPPAGDPYGPSSSTLRLDLSKLPSDPAFVLQTLPGSGVSALGGGGRMFGLGPAGLVARTVPMSACPADFNDNGSVDFFDIIAYLEAFSAGATAADTNGDGIINFFDLQMFLGLYTAGCS